MTGNAKIYLSKEEQHLVCNTEWILTKRKVLEKISVLFGELSVNVQDLLKKESWLPPEMLYSVSKISKGENYLGLPYSILDYPRFFSGNDIIAVRTMFWWGNFFSVTLHLAGEYKARFEERVSSFLEKAGNEQEIIYCCVNANQWHHHFEPENYRAVQSLEAQGVRAVIKDRDFIKLALRLPLQQTELAGEWLLNSIKMMLDILRP